MYVGNFCQFPNPCRPEADMCANNGTCHVLLKEQGPKASCQCKLGELNLCGSFVMEVFKIGQSNSKVSIRAG